MLLELIIDPTCSIVLERQPAESDIMDRKPRHPKEKLVDGRLLCKSVMQGLVIFVASFVTYLTLLAGDANNAPIARSMGLTIIMIANLFLVQVNSSNHDFALQSFYKLIKDKVMWAVNIGTLFEIIIILYTPLNGFLKLAPLSISQFFGAIGIAALSVLWYEVIKLIKKFL